MARRLYSTVSMASVFSLFHGCTFFCLPTKQTLKWILGGESEDFRSLPKQGNGGSLASSPPYCFHLQGPQNACMGAVMYTKDNLFLHPASVFGFERTELFDGSNLVGNLLCLWVTCFSTKTIAVVASPSLEDSNTQLEKALAVLIQYLQ